MKTYKITMTEEQMLLMAKAVEDWTRFLSGQPELFNAVSMLDHSDELYDKLMELHPLIVPQLHVLYGSHASYGWNGGDCPNENQRKAIAKGYGIYREIMHHFALEKGFDNVYTSPTLTCKEQGPLITIESNGE